MTYGTAPYGTVPYGGLGEIAPAPAAPTSTPPVPAQTTIPHLLVPFAITVNGSAQTIQQGSIEEIVQSVSNLIGTTPGSRYMVPTYGIPDPTFEGIDPVTLRLAVAKWEPRALVSVTSTDPSNPTVSVSPA